MNSEFLETDNKEHGTHNSFDYELCAFIYLCLHVYYWYITVPGYSELLHLLKGFCKLVIKTANRIVGFYSIYKRANEIR